MIIKLRGSARPCSTLTGPNRCVGTCTMCQGISYYCTDANKQEGDGYDSFKKAVETHKERQTPKWAIVEYSSTPTRQKSCQGLHPRRESRNKKRIAILLAEVNVQRKKKQEEQLQLAVNVRNVQLTLLPTTVNHHQNSHRNHQRNVRKEDK